MADILDTLPELDADSAAVLEEFRAAAAEELPLEEEAYDRFNAGE